VRTGAIGSGFRGLTHPTTTKRQVRRHLIGSARPRSAGSTRRRFIDISANCVDNEPHIRSVDLAHHAPPGVVRTRTGLVGASRRITRPATSSLPRGTHPRACWIYRGESGMILRIGRREARL
jgi:hypothetical protein